MRLIKEAKSALVVFPLIEVRTVNCFNIIPPLIRAFPPDLAIVTDATFPFDHVNQALMEDSSTSWLSKSGIFEFDGKVTPIGTVTASSWILRVLIAPSSIFAF